MYNICHSTAERAMVTNKLVYMRTDAGYTYASSLSVARFQPLETAKVPWPARSIEHWNHVPHSLFKLALTDSANEVLSKHVASANQVFSKVFH